VSELIAVKKSMESEQYGYGELVTDVATIHKIIDDASSGFAASSGALSADQVTDIKTRVGRIAALEARMRKQADESKRLGSSSDGRDAVLERFWRTALGKTTKPSDVKAQETAVLDWASDQVKVRWADARNPWGPVSDEPAPTAGPSCTQSFLHPNPN
jgi:hypothetical protein